ncbi:MAG: ATP-dependent Clp protease proteolytic subunit [Chloroflexi bacterium]|nr:ATP-dependent Clp protease proteolytic subunit [Chloroflexota bacterium]
MKKHLLPPLYLLLIALLLAAPAHAQENGSVLVLTLDGPITPSMTEYLSRGIKIAQRDVHQAIIIQLNTPGGSIEHMQNIVEVIRGSAIPVVIYVAPQGAIAGSAGTVITLAGHLAAMAPSTAIGAASPVGSQGEDLGETIQTKAKEIIKAQIRSLASHRGQEAIAFAEETVESAKAASAQEALQVGLIDFIAQDIPDLLQKIDGQTVETAKGEQTLNTANAAYKHLNLTLIEQLLQALTNPNIVFLLITIGVQAILIELSTPGAWVPGFVGAVCLALASYGLGVLPVNWFGIVFLIISFVLFILDIKAPTHGALTAAGIGSLITGTLVLFNSPGTPQFQRVSVWLVVISSLVTGGIFAIVMAFALRARSTPIQTGSESLVGSVGLARSRIARGKGGQAQVEGELWSAKLAPGENTIPPKEQIEVVAVHGIHLQVRKKH